jgi:hypothetical protein
VVVSYTQLRCTPTIPILLLFCTPTAASFDIGLSYISSARTTQHRKHLSFLSRVVIAVCLLVRYPSLDVLYCRVLLYVLTSNGCLPRICLRGSVFIEPLPSSGSTRHNIIIKRSCFPLKFMVLLVYIELIHNWTGCCNFCFITRERLKKPYVWKRFAICTFSAHFF